MRRLVPMPGPTPKAPKAAPPPPIVPTFRNSWPLFAWLIVTAIVMYYAKWPILLILALVGFYRGLFWLCERYPRTMLVIAALVRGLMGGRRR
jgi:hypothetical protein